MTDQPVELAEDSSVYKALLESTRAIPWKIDWKTMQFAYIGPQIEPLLGWTPESWISVEDWATRMHPEDQAWVVNFCVSQSESGVDHEADYRALHKDGHYVWIRDVVHVVRDEQGEVQALVGFMFDISERKKTEHELAALQQQLEEYSFKDGLTGVANRRMFDSLMEETWNHALRHRHPVSVILLDIDNFKQYNDLHGHLQGDECLKQIATLLESAAKRAKDFVARFGGEEFVIILPESDEEAARKVAERCQQLLFKAQIPHGSPEAGQRVTVSMGIGTVIPTREQTINDFLSLVDERLYQAKNTGRNRIVAA
ncbi:PAS/PAC sensor-containing diguanylate cyclase [Marinobacter santoriniensis NKSG1]|uniref:diguanylate cyclase n=1 Tax=Marinobacter santoriniensis NKSG1 TaxID=1288826 RepID=M7CRF9_9GAMM|nr:sensor domain-containing diguanylate cyclase [Marinobacter santoriniensis]EMP56226.1 PAS/PAC sensor-containing diguanylate cyclase [Marinobacter santoriniensis NKSG1]